MKILYPKPDGGVAIVIAASKADLERVLGPLTDNEYRQHVVERSVPKDIDPRRIRILPDDWQAPDDRTFRNAWVASGDRITVDMPKARDIHRQKLRQARKPELEALDVEALRATEKDDKAALSVVAQRKQKLRDVTKHPDIDACPDPDALKALTLDKLV